MDESTPSGAHRGAAPRRAITLAAVAIAGIVIVGAVIAGTVIGGASAPPAGSAAAEPPASALPAPGPEPDATPVAGSEVQPPDTTSRSAGVPLMTPAPRMSPVPAPTPDAETGGLADGYPAALAGPLPGDAVITSSVAAEGGTVQAALTARTSKTPDAIRDHYRDLWATAGLQPASGSDEEMTYTGPGAAMTLVVADAGTGTSYTLFAVLQTD